MKNIDFTKKCIPYDQLEVEKYLKDLKLVGSLSGLFSDSDIPLLHYRATENLYCADFNATNLARADVSADAKLKSHGVGIKTFTEGNKKTLQKVAEFNSQQSLYNSLTGIDKVKKVAELRNKRLEFTKTAYGLNDLIYHCIVRNKDGFYLFEEVMNFIDINNIKLITESPHTYIFTDGIEEYKFDSSKSTLYKRFITDTYFAYIKVDILTDPIDALRKISISSEDVVIDFSQSIIIPLYSMKNGEKIIYSKSGLNQWNAGGRTRDFDEVYIPFNSTLREMYEGFFPPRDTPFEVMLPNGNTMSMKLCQENCKALMSNPNKSLGKWLLRDVLKIPYGKIITYQDLLEIGIDSVSFKKIEDKKYMLDFKNVGEFENFINKEYMSDIDN